MYIFIDESGSFTNSPNRGAWCVVAAYVCPEHDMNRVEALAAKVREFNGKSETKLRNLTEDQYAWFLTELRKLEGVAFAIATDVGLHRKEVIEHHRNMQAAKVIENRGKMLYDEGRQFVTELSQGLAALPAQLYTQLFCQIELFCRIIRHATLYFVQRHPTSLANFRWRLDQKASVQTPYEDTFRKILPAMLQTMSLDDPLMCLKGEDYSHFERFAYPPGAKPSYLKTHYSIDIQGNMFNIGKIAGEDFQLVDSKNSSGVQIVDLIASGTRRLLRGELEAADRGADLLGANFVQPAINETAVQFISLDQSATVGAPASRAIHRMGKAARPMLLR